MNNLGLRLRMYLCIPFVQNIKLPIITSDGIYDSNRYTIVRNLGEELAATERKAENRNVQVSMPDFIFHFCRAILEN